MACQMEKTYINFPLQSSCQKIMALSVDGNFHREDCHTLGITHDHRPEEAQIIICYNYDLSSEYDTAVMLLLHRCSW
jgi:hypothetical protein